MCTGKVPILLIQGKAGIPVRCQLIHKQEHTAQPREPPLHHGRGGPQDPEMQPQRASIQELPLSSLFVSVGLELQKPTFLCMLMQNHDELSSPFWLCAELSRVPVCRLVLFII